MDISKEKRADNLPPRKLCTIRYRLSPIDIIYANINFVAVFGAVAMAIGGLGIYVLFDAPIRGMMAIGVSVLMWWIIGVFIFNDIKSNSRRDLFFELYEKSGYSSNYIWRAESSGIVDTSNGRIVSWPFGIFFAVSRGQYVIVFKTCDYSVKQVRSMWTASQHTSVKRSWRQLW